MPLAPLEKELTFVVTQDPRGTGLFGYEVGTAAGNPDPEVRERPTWEQLVIGPFLFTAREGAHAAGKQALRDCQYAVRRRYEKNVKLSPQPAGSSAAGPGAAC